MTDTQQDLDHYEENLVTDHEFSQETDSATAVARDHVIGTFRAIARDTEEDSASGVAEKITNYQKTFAMYHYAK